MDHKRPENDEVIACSGCEWCAKGVVPEFQSDEEAAGFWAVHSPELFGIPVKRPRLSPQAGKRRQIRRPSTCGSETLDNLCEFIWSKSDDSSNEELYEELEEAGLDPLKLVNEIKDFVVREETRDRLSWQEEAKAKNLEMEQRRLKRKGEILDLGRDSQISALKAVAGFRNLKRKIEELPEDEIVDMILDLEFDE
jgi:hypothetical protein